MKVNKLKLAMIFGAIFILATSITVNQSSPNGEEQITELRHLEDSCFTIGNRGGESYEIDSADAMQYIAGYQEYINGVKKVLDVKAPHLYPNKDQNLIYGVGTTICELKNIIASAQVQDNSEIWIMMGLMSNDSTEMIFALEGENRKGEKEWQYFDFTRPCPNSCPDWIGVNY